MNTIKLDIHVNNKNYNFVFNNVNDSDVKLNINLPDDNNSQIDRNEMEAKIRFLEERLRRSTRTNRLLQNRRNNQLRNREMLTFPTQQLTTPLPPPLSQLNQPYQQTQQPQPQQADTTNEQPSLNQQLSDLSMMLRLFQIISNATDNITANTSNAANVATTNTTNVDLPPLVEVGDSTQQPATLQTPAQQTPAQQTPDQISQTIETKQEQKLLTQSTHAQSTHAQSTHRGQTAQTTDDNIIISEVFNFADFLSGISTSGRRLYKDAGKVNRAPIPIEECILKLDNYNTILAEKPVQLKSYIEIAKAIDELIRNAMACSDRLISKYGILIDLEYSKYMVKMCKKSPQDIFDKFIELTDFEIPGETQEQAANRKKIKVIAENLRNGKLNDILHVLDTPGCNCQFCN